MRALTEEIARRASITSQGVWNLAGQDGTFAQMLIDAERLIAEADRYYYETVQRPALDAILADLSQEE